MPNAADAQDVAEEAEGVRAPDDSVNLLLERCHSICQLCKKKCKRGKGLTDHLNLHHNFSLSHGQSIILESFLNKSLGSFAFKYADKLPSFSNI